MRILALVVAAAFVHAPLALAQQPAPLASPTQPSAPPAKTYSQQDLDQILAPIALYPDALLAQILMASTYPLEIVEAARWTRANPSVQGKPLEEALTKQPWDPSVKALTAVPQVLQQMSDNLAWTQKLGDVFLAQQQDVTTTVQGLRAKAYAAGNLKTTPEQVVKTETAGTKTVYVVESPKTEVIYVPAYNPYAVYGTWWYPVPPYYVYPPHYVYPPGLAFATGVVVGAAIWGHYDWHRGEVNINVNHYNQFNRTTINNTSWNHNIEHRRGVAYKDAGVATRYNRGVDSQAARARTQYRGRDAGPSGSAGARPASHSSVADAGAFHGVDNASATRAASSRGGASRAGAARGSTGARGGSRLNRS